MTGEVQLTFVHATIGNMSLGESVVALALAGDLRSPSVVSINIDISFVADGDKIRLPIAEVLLRAAAGDFVCSKKQRDWTPRNAVLLPPFLVEAAILHGESDVGELLKILLVPSRSGQMKGKTSSGEDDGNDEDSEVSVEA